MISICPESFLYRMGGGATSAAYEIWATAHRLYIILATCQRTDTATRLFAFRCFVRLVMRYRAVLVAEAETCPLCRRDNRLSSRFDDASIGTSSTAQNCCWFSPDARGSAILDLLRKLGDMVTQDTADVDSLTEDFYLAKLYGDRAPNDLLDGMYILFSY